MPSQICVLHCAGSRQVSPKVVICKLFISANLAQFQNLFYNIPIHTHLEICAVKTLVAVRSAQWSRKRGHVHELETLERLPHFTKCGTKSLSNSGSLAVSQAEFCSFVVFMCKTQTALWDQCRATERFSSTLWRRLTCNFQNTMQHRSIACRYESSF